MKRMWSIDDNGSDGGKPKYSEQNLSTGPASNTHPTWSELGSSQNQHKYHLNITQIL